ncbi:hypothetical protein QQ045_026050 [Rhodiola kirilowii]
MTFWTRGSFLLSQRSGSVTKQACPEIKNLTKNLVSESSIVDSGHRVLISVNPCDILVCEKLGDVIEHEIGKDDVVLKVDSPVEFKFPNIIGSCDGMLCMMSGERFYLWNPSTAECREIRESDMRKKLDEYSIFGDCRRLGRMFGFGYDSLTDDHNEYKLESE